jgi:hypothetical protein
MHALLARISEMDRHMMDSSASNTRSPKLDGGGSNADDGAPMIPHYVDSTQLLSMCWSQESGLGAADMQITAPRSLSLRPSL